MKTFIYALFLERDSTISVYVGKSNNPAKRLQQHIRGSLTGKTRTARLIARLLKLNILPRMQILEEVDGSNWEDKEKYWISHFKLRGIDVTNHTSGGGGLHDPDEATRARISQSAKNRYLDAAIKQKYEQIAKDPKRRKRISDSLTGKPKKREHVDNLPQNKKGFAFSKKRNLKISQTLKEIYASGASLKTWGPLSEETKKKISAANKGKPIGLGRNLSNEHREAISKGSRGKPKSEEWKRKAKEAAKARWAKIRQTQLTGEKNE